MTDDTIAASIQHTTGPRLLAAPPCSPLPAQEALVRSCLARAQAAGLRFPSSFVVAWRAAGRDLLMAGGAVEWDGEKARVYLNGDLYPNALEETIFHEFQHLADFHSQRDLCAVAMERRAVEFAARMTGYL